MVVSVLTGAGHREAHAGRVPRADARNLAETTVGLTRQTGDAPTGDDTLRSVTLGGTENIDALILGEDGVDRHLLLKHAAGEVNLGGDVSTVDLDLADVCHLLPQLDEAHLGVGDDADDLGVLLDAVELGGDLLGSLGELLRVPGEGLLFRLVPVLVKPGRHRKKNLHV